MHWRKEKRKYRNAMEEAISRGELACELKVAFGYRKRNPYPRGRRYDAWQREYERLDDAYHDFVARRE
jgi:hypothetical protein